MVFGPLPYRLGKRFRFLDQGVGRSEILIFQNHMEFIYDTFTGFVIRK